jgi:fucose permease
MTGFNAMLILHFKESFTSGCFEAMLVEFAFLGTSFVGAPICFIKLTQDHE